VLKKIRNKKVVKNVIAMLSAQAIISPIQFVKGIIIAKFLSPADYGLLKTVELVQRLNKFGNLGFKAAATREVSALLSTGKKEHVSQVKTVAYKAEIFLGLILFIIGCGLSFTLKESQVGNLVLIASLNLFLGKVSDLFVCEAAIYKQFKTISKVSIFATVISAAFVVAAVPFFYIYAVLLGATVLHVISIIVFIKATKPVYIAGFDFSKFYYLLKISLPLAAGTLALGLFQYTERILIITYLGKEQLGYYSFGMMLATSALLYLKTIVRVRTRDLFDNLEKNKFHLVKKMVFRENGIICLAGIGAIPFMAGGIYILVNTFLTQWKSYYSLYVISLAIIPIQLAKLYPAVVLTSKKLNKQKLIPVLHVIFTTMLFLGVKGLDLYQNLTIYSFTVLVLVVETCSAMSFYILFRLNIKRA